MRRTAIALIILLSACMDTVPPDPAPEVTRRPGPVTEATLSRVAAAVMPMARSHCRARSSRLNCDFQVGYDPDPRVPANAFQTVGPDGRPQLVFNAALLADLKNSHELAFILGHEAAHHIDGDGFVEDRGNGPLVPGQSRLDRGSDQRGS